MRELSTNNIAMTLIDIVKVYESAEVKTPALRGITMEIRSGNSYFIQGPSGCGKSTLLNIIGLLDDPTTGEVRIGDQRIDNWTHEQKLVFRRENIGFIFQNSNLFPNFTVYQNLLASLHYNKLNREEKDKRIEMYLKAIQLEEKKQSFPHELSGGQKQRVAVIAALIKKPLILIADEPTAELDLENKKRVIDLIFDLKADNKNCCILVASHDIFFEERADFVIKLQDGLKVEDRSRLKPLDSNRNQAAQIETTTANPFTEFRLVLRCSKCNSTNIKKFASDKTATVRIVGENAIGMATIFCLDCNYGETKDFILYGIKSSN
jgi:putative ABC transport system ATP-binding protein